MSALAPIAVFAFNRPGHLRRALVALAANEEAARSHLTVFCDGPRSPADQLAVEQVRAVAGERQWCGTVEIRSSAVNRGLADSIIGGVTALCSSGGRVIVLEDDLVVSRHFLAFLNQALVRFADHRRVVQVAGHCFPARGFEGSAGCSFLPFTTTLGWGTWRRAWDLFDKQMQGADALRSNRDLAHRFNIDGAYPYTRLLSRLRRRNQLHRSWGIRWHWSAFQAGGLALYPHRSLVMHSGDDGSGTNVRGRQRAVDVLFSIDNRVSEWPEAVEVNEAFYASVRRYLRTQQTLWMRALRFLRRLLSS